MCIRDKDILSKLNFMKKQYIIFAILSSITLFSQERNLKNITKITDGGDNAEAYFSPDGRFLTMQVTNKNLGAECDQIFLYDLSKDFFKKSENLQLVSTGKGRTTCSYFMPDNKHILYASTHENSPNCPPPPIPKDGKYPVSYTHLYDSILTEYMTFPREMRTQKLRDSLFRKYNHPEYVGKSIFWSRVRHNIGKAPSILDESKTINSANSIRKFLVYRGYWDAEVDFSHKLDSIARKAKANYKITYKDPTYINGYFYNIPYENIRNIYEQHINESLVKSGEILDETKLEEEVKRISDLMQEKGYYSFNKDGGEIFFTADTLKSRKQVPLTMDIKKDSTKTPYRLYKIGNVEIQYLEKITDKPTLDTIYKNVNIKRIDNQYKVKALWRPITLKKDEIYNQKNLDLTKRNFIALNNFSIASYEASPKDVKNPNDTIINVKYKLIPLPKYNIKGCLLYTSRCV